MISKRQRKVIVNLKMHVNRAELKKLMEKMQQTQNKSVDILIAEVAAKTKSC